MTVEKGLFITLEGGEGSGKSTIIQLLKALFEEKGHEVVAFREPGGTRFAEEIRELFLRQEKLSAESAAILMNAARQDNIEKIIQPALAEGKVVIADRFTASTLVYQGMRKDAYETVRYFTPNIPMLTMFVDVPPEVGLKRIYTNNRETNRFDTMPLDTHQFIYEGYKKLGTIGFSPDVFWDIILDGNRSLEEIEQVLKKVLVSNLSKSLKQGQSTTETKKEIRLNREKYLAL